MARSRNRNGPPLPKGARRGTKVGERPGFVTVIARANENGELEVREEEYREYEEAERTKNDESASKEDKAVAALKARKYLNKWRERWVTKNPMMDDPMAQTPMPSQQMMEEVPGMSGVPSLKRRRDLEEELSDAGLNQGNSSRRKRSIVIDVPEDDGLILDKLSDLEAQMAHMESAIRLIQMKQTTLEAMVARILDILQPALPQ